MDKPDFSATQAIRKHAPGLAWLMPFRSFLTPAALWIAIGVLTTATGFVVRAQIKLSDHQDSITALQQDGQKDRQWQQGVSTQLAVMNSRLGEMATELDRQREWRENIETAAESPPHARRR